VNWSSWQALYALHFIRRCLKVLSQNHRKWTEEIIKYSYLAKTIYCVFWLNAIRINAALQMILFELKVPVSVRQFLCINVPAEYYIFDNSNGCFTTIVCLMSSRHQIGKVPFFELCVFTYCTAHAVYNVWTAIRLFPFCQYLVYDFTIYLDSSFCNHEDKKSNSTEQACWALILSSTSLAIHNTWQWLSHFLQTVSFLAQWTSRNVFLTFLKGCRGGALGCQHYFPFCLIFLTDFHKNASFRPIMLDYSNTTFTFGKQTIKTLS